MEIRIRKEIRLKTYFLQFLLHTALALLFTAAFWFAALSVMISSQIIIPANQLEQEVLSWRNKTGTHTTITTESIPSGADYAIYDLDQTLIETSFKDSLLEKASMLAASGQTELHADFSGRAYVKVLTDSRIVVVSYRLHASFANPILRRLLPSAEILILLSLFVLLVVMLVLVSFRYARRLEKEILLLQDVSEQIRGQNLDFLIPQTRIREFNRVMESLNALKEELTHSLKEQWQLEQTKKTQMSSLAHDIKTPLTIVCGNAQLLRESALDAEQKIYTDFILDNARQIQKYVGDIIQVSKDRNPSAPSSSCSLPNLLDDLEKTSGSLCIGKHLSFRLLADKAELPSVLPFPYDSLKRMLLNLLDNAVYYSPEKGIIALKICILKNSQTPLSQLMFEVRDEGPGFCAQALHHAADEFYRAEKSRSDRQHFGLGLTITKQLAAESGGTLSLSNRTDRSGAIAAVILPLPSCMSF